MVILQILDVELIGYKYGSPCCYTVQRFKEIVTLHVLKYYIRSIDVACSKTAAENIPDWLLMQNCKRLPFGVYTLYTISDVGTADIAIYVY